MLDHFERATEPVLFALALVTIPLIVLPHVLELPDRALVGIEIADWAIWGVFLVNYVVRLTLTDHRGRFVLREWPDLLIILVPLLRPLRLLRSTRALRLLRLGRLAGYLAKSVQSALRLLSRHHLGFVMMVAAVVVIGAAAVVWAVEEGDGTGIESFTDGLWWAIVTVTTVGYGDLYPSTPVGRATAVVLMLLGIAIFGVVTANIAAFFVEQNRDDGTSLDAKLDELMARLDSIERQLGHREARTAAGQSVAPTTGVEAGEWSSPADGPPAHRRSPLKT